MWSWLKKEETSVIDTLIGDFYKVRNKLAAYAETQKQLAEKKAAEVVEHGKEAVRAAGIAQKIDDLVS